MDSLVAEHGPYVAALGRREADEALHLFAVRRTGSALSLLKQPELMMEGYPPQRVEWLSIGGSGTDALLYTHDIPVEGVIGTVIYSLQADSMVLTFRSEADECRPAEVRDVDGDGRVELVAYTQDPWGGYCGSECHLDMAERFGMGPQWVDVHRWTESGWRVENDRFPRFYADLTRRYHTIQEWLDGSAPSSNRECKAAGWTRNRPIFREWAERAEALAGKG